MEDPVRIIEPAFLLFLNICGVYWIWVVLWRYVEACMAS